MWCLVLWTASLSCSDRATVIIDAGGDPSVVDKGQSLLDGPALDRSSVDGPLNDGAADVSKADVVQMDVMQSDGVGAVSCDPSAVTCKSLPGPCNIGEIRAVVGNCWGGCVPIEQCSDVPAQPDCDQTQIFCDVMPPICPKGYVPTSNGMGCYGPCVPITTCACTSGGPPTQCPKDYVCHAYAQRCGPLI